MYSSNLGWVELGRQRLWGIGDETINTLRLPLSAAFLMDGAVVKDIRES